MQLIWNDVLKNEPWLLKTIETYFSTMESMNCGKASTHFHEKAKELGNIVLTNKKFQTTRFVRSLQRANTAALRNLPTLQRIIAEDYEKARNNNENALGGKLFKVLNELMSAKRLFFGVALGQLLEVYCVASLEAQYSSHFPIQV